MFYASRLCALVLLPLVLTGRPVFGGLAVYYDNFDGGNSAAPGVSGIWSGVTTLQSVEGYNGLGNPGNTFSGLYLRNATPQPDRLPFVGPALGRGDDTTLTLNNLPVHTSISILFLAAFLDSWDGFGPSDAQPDRFNVYVDGVSVFSETMSEIPTQLNRGQSYVPPPSGLIVLNTQLAGYPGYESANYQNFTEAAYDMYLEPAFWNIPHSGSSATISWFADGAGYEGGWSESWAIDNVRVQVASPVPEPSSLVIAGMLLANVVAVQQFRQAMRRGRHPNPVPHFVR